MPLLLQDTWVHFEPESGDLLIVRETAGYGRLLQGTVVKFIKVKPTGNWKVNPIEDIGLENMSWYPWRFERYNDSEEERQKRKYQGILNKVNSSYSRQRTKGIPV